MERSAPGPIRIAEHAVSAVSLMQYVHNSVVALCTHTAGRLLFFLSFSSGRPLRNAELFTHTEETRGASVLSAVAPGRKFTRLQPVVTDATALPRA